MSQYKKSRLLNTFQFNLMIKFKKKNWFVDTNSNFLILNILQPDGANPFYFIFKLFDLTKFIILKYDRSTISVFKDINIEK